jgi:hypothetical protein
MKKSRLNKKFSVFLAAAVVSVVFLCPARPAEASTPFSDNFEAYSLGTIAGQGSWLSDYSGCDVVASPTYTGFRSVQCNGNNAYRIFTPLAASDAWEFWVYRPVGGSNRDFSISIWDENGTMVNMVRWLDATGKIYCRNGATDLGSTSAPGTWVMLGLKWDQVAQTVSCGINGAYTDYPALSGFDTDVKKVVFLEQNNQNMIVDDVHAGIPPFVSGYDPIITPTYPPDGETTITDMTEFDITGSVQVPTENPWIWHDLNVIFQKLNTTEITTKIIPLPDLIGGQDYTYSATSTLDNDYAYSVSYQIAGETTFYTTTIYNHSIANTYITYTAPITPSWTIAGPWPIPELEDCSSLTGLDKLVCEIKNFLLGLVIPTQSKFDELNNTFKAFQNIFPIPYLKSMQTFMTTTNAGINEGSGIDFVLFGQAGTVDFSALSFPVIVGGLTVNFNVLIKYFLSAVCLGAFIFWAFNFLNRIF